MPPFLQQSLPRFAHMDMKRQTKYTIVFKLVSSNCTFVTMWLQNYFMNYEEQNYINSVCIKTKQSYNSMVYYLLINFKLLHRSSLFICIRCWVTCLKVNFIHMMYIVYKSEAFMHLDYLHFIINLLHNCTCSIITLFLSPQIILTRFGFFCKRSLWMKYVLCHATV